MNKTESVCIEVENKEVAKIVWDFLLKQGFKDNNIAVIDKDYIWVNEFGVGVINYADNNYCSAKLSFNASTEFGALIEFFSKKPAPPESIYWSNATFYRHGAVSLMSGLYDIDFLNSIVSKRDAFMKQWADYNSSQ